MMFKLFKFVFLKRQNLPSAGRHTTSQHTTNQHTHNNNKHKQLYYCKGGYNVGARLKRVLHVRVRGHTKGTT
jgi:hypothetical protein